jgi:hypothetical protein
MGVAAEVLFENNFKILTRETLTVMVGQFG